MAFTYFTIESIIHFRYFSVYERTDDSKDPFVLLKRLNTGDKRDLVTCMSVSSNQERVVCAVQVRRRGEERKRQFSTPSLSRAVVCCIVCCSVCGICHTKDTYFPSNSS